MLIKTIVKREKKHCASGLPDSMHPVLRRVIQQRDCGYTEYRLQDLLRPSQLKNIDLTVEKLIEYRETQKRILIVGDYDCDGATATSVAVIGLEALGFKKVDFLIPNRFKSGYGLSVDIVKQALQLARPPEVLITVDNGISSIDGVDFAIENGLEVIITDHHLPGSQLPKTETIINPQLEGDLFQSKAIAGVGVMFYCLLALRQKMKESGYFQIDEVPNFMHLLDLVALGTIADCVPLDKNNRILISHGLQRIRAGKMRPGIRALLDNPLQVESLTCTDIAFRVAPKLNAVGRMDDMTVGIKCLLSKTDIDAQRIALILKNHNEERRNQQSLIQNSAMKKLQRVNRRGIVLYDPDWHQGIIGIVASKIKEAHYKPCIIFAEDKNGLLKGSGRSIDGIHLRDILAKIAEKSAILEKFGGHSMAAGLSLHKKDLLKFTDLFEQELAVFSDDVFVATLFSDGSLSQEELSLKTAEALQHYGIWGQGYEEPLFEQKMTVLKKSLIKGVHIKCVLRVDGCLVVNAMWFSQSEKVYCDLNIDQEYRFTYKLSVNQYLGEKNLTLLIDYCV